MIKIKSIFINIYNFFFNIAHLSELLVYKLAFRISEVSSQSRSHLQIPQVQCRSVHILRPRSLIRVEYAITRAWASGIGPLPVGERSLGRRVVEQADGMSDGERRRDRTAQRKWAVREMAPNRLVCRWTHYLSHADSTDILDARLIALMASLRVRVSRAIRERPRPRAEISNVAMSTVLTKAPTSRM